jgi:hypothetical protein
MRATRAANPTAKETPHPTIERTVASRLANPAASPRGSFLSGTEGSCEINGSAQIRNTEIIVFIRIPLKKCPE